MAELILKRTAVTAAIAGVVGGAIFGISKIDIDNRTPQQKFDELEYAIPGGTALTVGQTLPPEYRQLPVSTNSIPGFMYESGRSSYYDSLDGNDTLRSVVIKSSKKGKNCETFPINNVPPDSKLYAWTDFIDPRNGKSRAGELQVTFQLDKGTVCWTGKERNDDDDPIVVVSLNTQNSAN